MIAVSPTQPTRPDPASLDTESRYYYRALGDGRYQPTIHAQGAWNDWEQHMAPASGLLTHAIERYEDRPDMQLARITFEILGVIPASEVRVECTTVRPGRTIELVEAVMLADTFTGDGSYAGSKPVIRATAWRLTAQDTSEVAGGFHPGLPAPADCPEWDGMQIWGGGFIRSLDFRSVEGGVPGRGRAWVSTPSASSTARSPPTSHASSASSTPPTASRCASTPASGCSPTST